MGLFSKPKDKPIPPLILTGKCTNCGGSNFEWDGKLKCVSCGTKKRQTSLIIYYTDCCCTYGEIVKTCAWCGGKRFGDRPGKHSNYMGCKCMLCGEINYINYIVRCPNCGKPTEIKYGSAWE